MYDDKNIDYKVLGIQKSSVILFSMGKTIVSSNKNYKIWKMKKFLQDHFYFSFVVDINIFSIIHLKICTN